MSVVTHGKARFTVLTSRCIRLEYSEAAVFVDEATLFARERPRLIACSQTPHANISVEKEVVRLQTDHIRLLYINDGHCFHAGNLSAEVRLLPASASSSSSDGSASSAESKPDWVRWEAGMVAKHNLGGTLPTLDNLEGPVDLGLGLLSRDGYFLLDDSGTPVLHRNSGWAQSRPENASTVDWYFFGYGLDFQAALQSLMAVSGRVPMPRRYALGSWYSRFWPHTSQEFRDIVAEFKQHGYPLDVIVLDMDWHKKGWTGWSWNRHLLPDAEDLLKWFHEEGLHVTLNLHPADGVAPHEDAYKAFMNEMTPGVADQTCTLQFDAADERYMSALFRHVHGPLEEQGVDFWWLDWQQDKFTRSIPELTNWQWLNELYFRQSKARGLRGLQFSRWGGWGDHTKPIHFSGDASTDWPMLAFLVPFTSTSSNVGCFFWSHDIGGHLGPRNEECYARWAQFTATSAAMRIHSSRSEYKDCRPWKFHPQVEASLRVSWQLRHSLMPYIYSAAFQCHMEMRPLIRPMYLDLPGDEEAYRCPSQFGFGDAFVVAPIVSRGSGQGCLAQQTVWLPSGIWYNYLTCERFQGGQRHLVAYELDEFPIFVKAGCPVPLQPPAVRMCTGNSDVLHVRCFPGVAGRTMSTVLYEDDGETMAYESGERALTHLSCIFDQEGSQATVEVGPARGKFAGQLVERSVVIEFCACAKVVVHSALVGSDSVKPTVTWQQSTWISRIALPKAAIEKQIVVIAHVSGIEEAAEEIARSAITRRTLRALGRSQSLGMASVAPLPTDLLKDIVLQKDLPHPMLCQALAAHGFGLQVVNEGLYLYEQRLVAYLYWPQAIAADTEANSSACEIQLFFRDGRTNKFTVRTPVWHVAVDDAMSRIEARIPMYGQMVPLSWIRNVRIGQIRNRWRDHVLRVQQGSVGVAPSNGSSELSQWEVAAVPGEHDCVRIRLLNGNIPEFLHTENGKVEVGAVQANCRSAKWKLDAVHGLPPLKRLRQNDVFLHIEHGKLEVGPIRDGWWSAQWKLPGDDGDVPYRQQNMTTYAELQSRIFKAISKGDKKGLDEVLLRHPDVLLQRSKDGRGPLWWAWEHRNEYALHLLARLGVNLLSDELDQNGQTPRALGPENWRQLAETAARPHESDKVVYFIRHGYSEAQAAEAEKKGSRGDLKLRDAVLHRRGIDQALELQGAVSSWDVEHVLCSPLRRCLHTAALLFKDSQVPIELCSKLREASEHFPENIGIDPAAFAAWIDSESIPRERLLGIDKLEAADTSLWDPQGEWQLLCHGSESKCSEQEAARIEQSFSKRLEGLNRRLWKWWVEMLARKERTLAVVAHYGVIRKLFGGFDLKPDNCSVLRVPFAQTNGHWLHGIPTKC